MSSFLLGVLLLSFFGILILTTQGFAQSIATPSDVNKIGGLQVFDLSGETLLGLNLGTSDSITSITLTFNSNIPNDSLVSVSLADNNNEIGSGFTTVNPSSDIVVISLSDVVTDTERTTLKSATITLT